MSCWFICLVWKIVTQLRCKTELATRCVSLNFLVFTFCGLSPQDSGFSWLCFRACLEINSEQNFHASTQLILSGFTKCTSLSVMQNIFQLFSKEQLFLKKLSIFIQLFVFSSMNFNKTCKLNFFTLCNIEATNFISLEGEMFCFIDKNKVDHSNCEVKGKWNTNV